MYAPDTCPPTDQNFLNLIFLGGKIWQICMLAPLPGGLASTPRRNPESWILPFEIRNFHQKLPSPIHLGRAQVIALLLARIGSHGATVQDTFLTSNLCFYIVQF